MHVLIYLILVSLVTYNVHCNSETCSANKDEPCHSNSEINKYSKVKNTKYSKIFATIEKAEANYVECEADRSCVCHVEGLTNDLKVFKKRGGISKEMIDEARTMGVFYQIINGEVYREKNCMFPSRCSGVEYFLQKLPKLKQNISIVINVRDYPQWSKYSDRPVPILSFSKTSQYYDIMYPAWAFWEGGPAISLYPRGIGRWDKVRQSIKKAGDEIPWGKKEEKAFFRGSRTSNERDELIVLSRFQPDLVDAQYTKNQAWRSEKDTLGMPPATEVPLESHCTYKYLFNYRGIAASFRHKHLFLCGSLVFHVGDEWKEFYYEALKPWIHYVPVPSGISTEEIEELLQFMKDNDDIAKKIAERGRNFIWEKLTMSDVHCYWQKLIRRYARLLTFEPKLEEGLIKITKRGNPTVMNE